MRSVIDPRRRLFVDLACFGGGSVLWPATSTETFVCLVGYGDKSSQAAARAQSCSRAVCSCPSLPQLHHPRP
ncbi:unnamed protein product [Boreogadus saida]